MEVLKFGKFEAKDNGIKRHMIDNFVVFQGKNADANDYLTMELANDDDIWMHAKGVPGSHVLIKVMDFLPTMDVIKKAAQIAADNSKGKSGDNITVVYCKRKFVHKKENMNPGQVEVEYKNSDQIMISKK